MIAAAVSGDRQAAEDIVQDAALTAVGKWRQYTPGTHLAAWLAEITRLSAQNFRRKSRRRKTHAMDPQSLFQVSTTRSQEPDRVAETNAAERDLAQKDLGSGTTLAAHAPVPAEPLTLPAGEPERWQIWFDDQVWQALCKLQPEIRSCLLLRTVHQLSFAEIAELQGIPEGTAMSRVHRARAFMKSEITALWAESKRKLPATSGDFKSQPGDADTQEHA